ELPPRRGRRGQERRMERLPCGHGCRGGSSQGWLTRGHNRESVLHPTLPTPRLRLQYAGQSQRRRIGLLDRSRWLRPSAISVPCSAAMSWGGADYEGWLLWRGIVGILAVGC